MKTKVYNFRALMRFYDEPGRIMVRYQRISAFSPNEAREKARRSLKNKAPGSEILEIVEVKRRGISRDYRV